MAVASGGETETGEEDQRSRGPIIVLEHDHLSTFPRGHFYLIAREELLCIP